jgi:hypothetical protein
MERSKCVICKSACTLITVPKRYGSYKWVHDIDDNRRGHLARPLAKDICPAQ